MKRGRFITIEGGEGTGKTTQAALLTEALRTRGIIVVPTREPGGAPGAEEIRDLLIKGDTSRWDAVSEALLHFAARREHLKRTILPALERGDWVVSDRFADSTMAYQGHGHRLKPGIVAHLYEIVVGDFAPDLTIILDLPVAAGLERARRRGGPDRYECMDEGFHERLRQGYLAIARREPRRCTVIDASPPPAVVHAELLVGVQERLGLAGDG